jgi:hypothetical protein
VWAESLQGVAAELGQLVEEEKALKDEADLVRWSTLLPLIRLEEVS